jgi:hypothetical protein
MTMLNSTAAIQGASNRAAIGVLRFEQAAAELPAPPGQQALALKRLVARGAVPAVENATIPDAGISIDALKNFLLDGAANRAVRQSVGAPPETLLPIFLGAGDWFDLKFLSHLAGDVQKGLVKLIGLQMPPSYDEMQAAVRLGSTKWGNAVSKPGDTFMPAELTADMQALIRRPIDVSQLTAPKGIEQAKYFRNAAEVLLVSRLQAYAYGELIRREDQQRYLPGAPAFGGRGLDSLYASASVYADILSTSISAMQNSVGSTLQTLIMPDVKDGNPSSRKFGMFISEAMILQAAGTSYPRLAALAF